MISQPEWGHKGGGSILQFYPHPPLAYTLRLSLTERFKKCVNLFYNCTFIITISKVSTNWRFATENQGTLLFYSNQSIEEILKN